MKTNRIVEPVRLARYVARHLDGQRIVVSDALTILSINDLCCYQRLLLIASRNDCPPSMRTSDPHLQMLRRVRVAFVPNRVTRNAYLQHQQFTIRLEAA